MNLRIRLNLLGLIPLVLAILMIFFITSQVMLIQNSSKNDAGILVGVEKFRGDLTSTKQGLSNYSFNPSDANLAEAKTSLDNSNASLQSLTKQLKAPEQKALLKKISEKYTELSNESSKALENQNKPAVNRQAMRVSGILNDVFLLNKQANELYKANLDKTKAKIGFIILFSIIGSILLVVLSLILSWVLSNRIVKPVNTMVKNAERVAQGDLSIQMESGKPQSKYELDKLAAAFSQMVMNLRDTVQSIEKVGEDVQEFAEGVTKQMFNLTEISNQVAASTEELSKGSQSMSDEIQSTAIHTSVMREAFEQNVQESLESLSKSKEALESVEIGKQSLTKQKSLSDQMAQSSSEISQAVAEFRNYTGQIEDAAVSVNQIAEQTNLLALNAAIEAARAGEAGKGFAVVAEEVRKLAEDSSKATKLITDMVKNIKDGIQHVIGAAQNGQEISVDQVHSMEETGQSFESISTSVNSIFSQLNELVSKLQDSSHKSSDILAAIENISAVTEEAAAGTEEISASTDEQLRSFNHLNELISTLHQMTENMKKEMDKFTL
ncbi:methyl-accepting chemotaxis protein [Falsibacillus pallidus]|uniref:Methyl-accepting chemotaxis protein n=1 Tax=Falsibacillus pallidus TaxID=493781 RepID=A0A370GEM9_9BACI|nr:HAMP domain-containing methyl-accepting chemotaxis protein [Falsibacillus pallidus]RDI42265.1 methyl-accepting chemotaxis protein [Falsibacillus pallidus]